MNELEAAIPSIHETTKKFMEDEESRHAEYMHSRSDDVACMDSVEAQLIALQVSSSSNGVRTQSLIQPFQPLTGV